MSLTAAALRLLAEKGLSAADIVELAECLEVRRDPTAAERMRRMRERKAVTRNVTPVTENPPPNEYISNPPVPQTAKAVSPPFSEKVVSSWNDMAERSGATACRGKLNTQRQAHLRSRVKENGEEAVLEAIRNIGGSKFHCGENDRGCKASLGWLLKSSENFDKALELAPPKAAKQLSESDRASANAFLELKRAYEAGEITFEEFMARKSRPPDEAPRQRTGPRPIGSIISRIQDRAA